MFERHQNTSREGQYVNEVLLQEQTFVSEHGSPHQQGHPLKQEMVSGGLMPLDEYKPASALKF